MLPKPPWRGFPASICSVKPSQTHRPCGEKHNPSQKRRRPGRHVDTVNFSSWLCQTHFHWHTHAFVLIWCYRKPQHWNDNSAVMEHVRTGIGYDERWKHTTGKDVINPSYILRLFQQSICMFMDFCFMDAHSGSWEISHWDLNLYPHFKCFESEIYHQTHTPSNNKNEQNKDQKVATRQLSRVKERNLVWEKNGGMRSEQSERERWREEAMNPLSTLISLAGAEARWWQRVLSV